MFLTLIKTLIALQGGLSPVEIYPVDYGPNLKNEDKFDFIIVGGGSAGSVLANRLSEIPEWKVLLIEAGGYPSGMSEIPAITMSLQNTDEDWQYPMEPSNTCCLGLKNKICTCPRGKALGGSTTINFMMYTRSTRYDHERWTSNGNDGWDYDSIEKYYRKLEHAHIDDNRYYGTDGLLHITRYTNSQPIRNILWNAYEELGYHEYTEENPIGVRDHLLSIYQGTRQNAAKAFLSPVRNRPNLYVAINAQVSRILIDPHDLIVSGVEVKIHDQIIKVRTNKEVILSAGSINSPQILMNSGIGPKEHLSNIGIKVIRDLKVGENYQDHLAFPFLAVGVDESAAVAPTFLQLVNEMYRYFMNRQGELGKLDFTNFASYINTKNETNFANVQYIHTLTYKNDPYFLQESLTKLQMPESVSDGLFKYNKKSHFVNMSPVLLHPKSSGHIQLRDADPFSKPKIIPNFLSDENDDDINVLLDAVKHVKKLTETKALAPYNPEILYLDVNNCQGFAPKSDDYWKCAIRNIPLPLYHPVGTCKMGPQSDPLAVVDPQLRVHGVKRLRVIDASIMPIIPSCNTNAPTLMIGEKGADLIKNDWIKQRDEL